MFYREFEHPYFGWLRIDDKPYETAEEAKASLGYSPYPERIASDSAPSRETQVTTKGTP